MRRIEMKGQRYTKLLVLEEVGKRLIVRCDCGTEKEMLRVNVLAGYSKTCGCGQRLATSVANTKHGLTGTPTYVSWSEMRKRCNNYMKDNYERYGGRGITYDPRWDDFNLFLEDMGVRPEGLELDREDNNGPYCKENCRWVTHKENCNNRGY